MKTNKITKVQHLAERIYRHLLCHSKEGKIQIGYNEIGRQLGEANLGMIHRALQILINENRIQVLYDNGGRGGRKFARIYGITELLRVYGRVSVA